MLMVIFPFTAATATAGDPQLVIRAATSARTKCLVSAGTRIVLPKTKRESLDWPKAGSVFSDGWPRQQTVSADRPVGGLAW